MTKLSGTIEKIGIVKQITDKFKKRDLLVNTGGDYPQLIVIQFVQDKASMLDGLTIGQEVVVSYNLRGSKGKKGGYFVNLDGWKIGVSGTSGFKEPKVLEPIGELPTLKEQELEDDLPF